MIGKLLHRTLYAFKTMTAEDYLYNQRDAMFVKTPHVKALKPLENANQGDIFITDEVQLVGVPKGQTKPKF